MSRPAVTSYNTTMQRGPPRIFSTQIAISPHHLCRTLAETRALTATRYGTFLLQFSSSLTLLATAENAAALGCQSFWPGRRRHLWVCVHFHMPARNRALTPVGEGCPRLMDGRQLQFSVQVFGVVSEPRVIIGGMLACRRQRRLIGGQIRSRPGSSIHLRTRQAGARQRSGIPAHNMRAPWPIFTKSHLIGCSPRAEATDPPWATQSGGQTCRSPDIYS
ncbi:hypothetical protein BU25DRAFT_452704 [Macroventuria anomochaeta]|uniref:Uncharacterized protein n=1 Tax=Macroventuria anomochaeta TaxID=301207 RepID=A0ACB6RI51_9PLEO|nr:uncharacterized protein BU25DRAFT_452704 [Macroventuria anomochaeta]KAF2621439.1 hypothetical protein BU25DRAFT_452704 [Macroventuria anomochaeta]